MKPTACGPGKEVKISLPDQGKNWTAHVSNAVPQFDPVTRSLQLRLEMDNPGLVLRPDMFVNVDLEVHVPDALTVPTEALLDSGITKIVYVDHGDGAFEPRQIQTGRRSGNRVEIVSGLAPGEKIVVSGTFLLDSESRLRFPQRAVSTQVMPGKCSRVAKVSDGPGLWYGSGASGVCSSRQHGNLPGQDLLLLLAQLPRQVSQRPSGSHLSREQPRRRLLVPG